MAFIAWQDGYDPFILFEWVQIKVFGVAITTTLRCATINIAISAEATVDIWKVRKVIRITIDLTILSRIRLIITIYWLLKLAFSHKIFTFFLGNFLFEQERIRIWNKTRTICLFQDFWNWCVIWSQWGLNCMDFRAGPLVNFCLKTNQKFLLSTFTESKLRLSDNCHCCMINQS